MGFARNILTTVTLSILLAVHQGPVLSQRLPPNPLSDLLLSALFGNTRPVTETRCGGPIEVNPGRPSFIESPSILGVVVPNVRCNWQIVAPEGYKVRLSFDYFNLKANDNTCLSGFVHISDSSAPSGKRFCTSPPAILSSENSIFMRYVVNSRINDGGFRAKAEALKAKTGKLMASLTSQIITTPNYPNDYPNNYIEGWVIESPNGMGIKMECDKTFHLQGRTGSCQSDFLLVSRTGNLKFTDGKKYCGQDGPGTIVSNESIALIFKSDSTSTFPGFRCQYQAIRLDPSDLIDSSGCQCGFSNLRTRVVGGITTEINEYPWQVGISTRKGYLFCGGTLINNRYILTAAHCTRGRSPTSLVILLGEHDHTTSSETDSIKVSVSDIIRHPDYDTITNNNDIAILKMSKSIDFDFRMKPPCFTRPGIDYTGQIAVVTGWGAIREGGKINAVLQEVTIPVISLDKCRNAYGKSMITNNMLCAGKSEGGKDSCQGDSGGPLVWEHNNRWHLIGIVSWGYGCARPNTPGVYTRVDRFLDWIDKNTRDAQYC